MRAVAVAVMCIIAGCDHREPITSCDQDLHGTWSAPGGRWMLLDNGATLEFFPLFDDGVPDGAPRVIDVKRGDQLGGDMKRRFMRGADECNSRTSFHITSCSDETLQVVFSDVSPPLTYAPCTWPQSAPARVERWHRE